MPVLFITTNLEKTVVPKDEAILALSKVAAKLSGKPEAFISVVLNTNVALSFGGTLEPTALVEFSNLEGFSVDENVITELTEAIYKNVGVPKDRFFIKFNIVDPNHISHNGKSIAEIIKAL